MLIRIKVNAATLGLKISLLIAEIAPFFVHGYHVHRRLGMENKTGLGLLTTFQTYPVRFLLFPKFFLWFFMSFDMK